MKWSYKSPRMDINSYPMTNGFRMVIKILSMYFDLFKHVSFWCLFIHPNLTTSHSNLGVHVSAMLD